ncbi:nitroreductase [Actibacterium lipolyticum]|uniref:Nitroreductase A n=1 Tax=Actibacterium lipolyticum TaxID=1524263 RepID=A0A238KIG2_9RHOB|nr:nitroreductase [Actibacterium lipolyticum]SMX42424.1 nitroreductase A [Actibacterium lipolyticum]
MTPSSVENVLWQRKSVRAYLDTPLPQEDVARILRAARQAPSGANLQPGKFHALTGAPLSALKQALDGAITDGRETVAEYSYFPQPMPADLKAKQRAAGYALYQALGIERRDFAGRKAQFDRNYRFFDAPVGIVVTIHPDMGKGCYMDLGMALMALFLAAEDLGYATSGIGALAKYADVTHTALDLPKDELVVCGIALGVEDKDAPVNNFRTERDSLEGFATLRGFEE